MLFLGTEDSPQTFKIHKAHLESKSKLFKNVVNFKEGQEGVYRFHDISEITLARFIEWAYTGNYPEKDRNVNLESASAMKKLGDAAGTTADSSPLSCNMKMYIFGHIYGILPLQALAFDRVTAYLTKMRRPRSEKLKLEVIAAMEMCFKEILPNDRLLKWLGHYASYCLSDLKKMPEFQKLLEGAPSLSLTMLKYMKPAKNAPWP